MMRARKPFAVGLRPTREEAAERIAVTAAELSRLASAHRMPFLATLCEMATLEAWPAASEVSEPQADVDEAYERPNGSGASHERVRDMFGAAPPLK